MTRRFRLRDRRDADGSPYPHLREKDTVVTIDWTASAIALRLLADDDGPVRLVEISTTGSLTPVSGEPGADGTDPYHRIHQPLVEVMTPQVGMLGSNHSLRQSGTQLGQGLRYVRHETTRTDGADGTDGADVLTIEQLEPETGLTTVSTFEAQHGAPAVRSTTTVSVAAGKPRITLWAVSSFATGAVISDDLSHTAVWRGLSTWAAEHRWSSQPLRSPGLAEIDRTARGETVRGAISTVSTSTWSSGAYVPAGAVTDTASGRTLAWQIEHNGAWVWEVGERQPAGPPQWTAVGSDEAAGPPSGDRSRDGGYVVALGPTDTLHSWSVTVGDDVSFTSVPVTFTAAASFDEAFGQLAAHRRAARRQHPQNDALPVIFNDYMDTLEGDPTEAKLLPLIDAAAAVGAQYFCIDAGWYDDTAGWWASVGDWEPSTARFPRGFGFVLDHIRSAGLVPGLWLEPEVVGVTSRAAGTLPDSAFLQRGGVRVRERDRYLLDLRSADARAHLDAAVDRLVGDLGIGFFKLDYNVTPGLGTDLDSESVGDGLLQHNRALLTWLDGVLDRHPDLVLENCGSGAMRSDFAMLSRLQLQSTSDQQDPLLYPMIAVGALVHILPEQSGNWAYPQATMTDELIAFTMCTGLAGRLYQSGLLDRMSADQLALVTAGVQAHRDTRHTLARSVPRFPTGLPSWDQGWVTVAFDAGSETLVLAWRQEHAETAVTLELPHLAAGDVDVTQLYPPVPTLAEWKVARTPTGLSLTSEPGVAAARMLRVTAR
jgi:alpha-galactosidase